MIREQDIALARSFNRLVARQVGALGNHLGHRPLGELRVLFEIGAGGTTPRDVRVRLGLDSGYLARVLRTLQRDGLVAAAPSPEDRRTKRLRVTRAGRAEMRELDRLSDELAASALEPLSDEQRSRLLSAQAEVRRLLAISMVTIAPEDPASLDARWCLDHYFAELRERFEQGFDPKRTLPAEGELLLARFGGQPAGCGMLETLAPGVGEILRMWVDRPHRGLGIGARILEALEARATALGHGAVRLYTNRSLVEGIAMYRARGYVEIGRYNDDPYATHWFEKRLAAKTPALTLRPLAEADAAELRRIRATPEVARWWDPPEDDFPWEEPEASRLTIEVDGRVAGMVQVAEELEPKYRHAGIDLFLDPAVHGRGLGTEVVRRVARQLIEERGHHRVTIDPAAANVAAIRAYEKVGFRRVGVMRRYERDADGWHDGLLMELVAD